MTATAIATGNEGQLFVLQQDHEDGRSEVLVYQTLIAVDGDHATFRTNGGTEWIAVREGKGWVYRSGGFRSAITVLRGPGEA